MMPSSMRATAAEATRMLNAITRSNNFLARRIGRAPGKMLSFARSRGANFARGLGRGVGRGMKNGLNPKNLGKGFGKPHKQNFLQRNFKNPLRGKKLFNRKGIFNRN